MAILRFCIMTILTSAPILGQQAPPKAPNELLTGKIMCVSPMPDNIDQWLRDFLGRWGKYKLTGNPEGVDLVLRGGQPPERGVELENRDGVTQPKGAGSRLPAPLRRHGGVEVPVVTFDVVNWVTGERIWHADVLNRKQKKDEPDPPPGPETKIFARGMTPDQLAMKVTRTLQAYVAELEKTGGAKQH